MHDSRPQISLTLIMFELRTGAGVLAGVGAPRAAHGRVIQQGRALARGGPSRNRLLSARLRHQVPLSLQPRFAASSRV